MRGWRKIAGLTLVMVLVAAVSAYAGSKWGTYKGYPIAKLYVDDKEVATDVPPIIMDGRTLVPLRVVSERLGAKVSWDGTNYIVRVYSPGYVPPGSTPPKTGSPVPQTYTTPEGFKVTVNSVKVSSDGVVINVTAANGSSTDAHAFATSAQIVAGGKQYEESDVDAVFLDKVRPGGSITGNIYFPAIPSTATTLDLYIPLSVGNEFYNDVKWSFELK